MVKRWRWPFIALLVVTSGCSAILGFNDGEPLDGADAGGDSGDDRSAAADTGIDSTVDSHVDARLDAPTDAPADVVAEAKVDADADADATVDAGPKQAFETIGVFNGRLDAPGVPGAGGLAAGDARCMEEAQASFPGRTFVAWLSTAAITANSRVAGGGPWYVGATYLGTPTELATGTLQTPLNKGPAGEAVPAPLGVWTGTAENGTSAMEVCDDWTAPAGPADGEIGTGGGGAGTWTYAAVRLCNTAFHLYCFEK